MAEVHHFTYGWITPVAAYGMSVLGSLLGLVCAARARETDSKGRRTAWLILAAVAIGGTGIWLMHFLAMLGFTVPASDIRYAPALTGLSAVMAIVVVGIGLFIVGFGRSSFPRILAGGLFTGFGVAAMHYTGMAAMRLDGSVGYERGLVVASVAIAVAAATVALWFTITLRGIVAISIAAMVMGVAVCGMHYTGMAAMRVHIAASAHPVAGAEITTFLLPMVLFSGVVLALLLYATLSAPTVEERAADALFAGLPITRPAQAAAQGAPGARSGDLWHGGSPLTAAPVRPGMTETKPRPAGTGPSRPGS